VTVTLHNVTKQYPTRAGTHTALCNVNLTVRPGEKLGILGRNGSGKSTLIRLIGGADKPSSGRIARTMRVSWPLALISGFGGSLTGRDSLRLVCRLYGVPWRQHLGFVMDFTELGRYFDEPVQSYSHGMMARLAFAVSMVIDFDCFLIDEVVAVGDSTFTERCNHELFEKRRHKAMVIVSHQEHFVRQHCTRAAVLVDGHLHSFDSNEQAFDYYQASLQAPQVTPA
jgi:capsular polysaccharide transport system ATP-binding protein